MNKLTLRLLAAAALASIPVGVSAHRLWFLPSGTIFSGTDSWVTVDMAASNDLFYADHQPGRLEGVKVWRPDGSEGRMQNGSTGRYRSVFDVALDAPGTWKIGMVQDGLMGSFKVGGVEKRVGGRPQMGPDGKRLPPLTAADIPADATEVKLTEVSSRNEIYVTAGEPTTTVLKPVGRGLEADWQTHPDELVAGEPARVRFLIDGKPAANLKVTLVPGGKRYRDAEGARELVTAADGTVALDWPAAGMYWLNAVAEDRTVTQPRATGRRMSFTSTVEVMTP
ncbi:nickel uptake transporter family protein [Sphingomonas spermidinifaciens]|uniref:Nickel uptake transporter family protein n=1 Tax=Sphingomonas spermidinifaciens TaxID=1141889 RepID=A0A2A4B5W4_9SPHN|nr:DUF4198 domain-containing protein [Sphingomonas spermidinifaciens]PCD03470.1 nickel uptake transporter family protein [Sphingomonas spermidinifaciens]